MICRAIKKENNKHNIVWFNSYGKEILNPKQEFNIRNNVTQISNVRRGQRFIIQGTSSVTTDITFQKSDYTVVEMITFTGSETKVVKGVLSDSFNIIITNIDNFSSLTIIFEEYAIAKKYKEIIADDLQSKDKYYNQRIYLSYDNKQWGLNDSLTQRLSILKGELWYKIDQGLPLIDKIKSKYLIDASILTAISDHPDVDKIINFSSKIENGKYTCNVSILSKFGQLNIII